MFNKNASNYTKTHKTAGVKKVYHFEVDPQFSPKTIATSTDFKDPIPTASGSAPILPRAEAGAIGKLYLQKGWNAADRVPGQIE